MALSEWLNSKASGSGGRRSLRPDRGVCVFTDLRFAILHQRKAFLFNLFISLVENPLRANITQRAARRCCPYCIQRRRGRKAIYWEQRRLHRGPPAEKGCVMSLKGSTCESAFDVPLNPDDLLWWKRGKESFKGLFLFFRLFNLISREEGKKQHFPHRWPTPRWLPAMGTSFPRSFSFFRTPRESFEGAGMTRVTVLKGNY